MKKLLVVVLLIVGLVVGGHFYFVRQIEQGLDDIARNLQFFGSLTYGKVSLTYDGEARINDLRFRVYEMQEEIVIDALVLRTDSIFGLYKITDEFDEGRIPEKLGLSVLGLRLPTDGNIVAALYEQDDEPSLEAAGCGDYKRFGPSELIRMGYSRMEMDIHLDYRIIGGGQILEVDASVVTHDAAAYNYKLEIGLGAASRRVEDVAMTMMGATVMSMNFEFVNRGYVDRVVDFCTQHTGLNRTAFLEQHHEAWLENWRADGYKPGPDISSAYESFLSSPGQFSVRFRPTSPLPVMQIPDMTPEVMAYRLQGDIQVNRRPAGRWDMGAMSASDLADLRVERRRQRRAEERASLSLPDPEVAVPVFITTAELSQHMGRRITIRLNSGRTMTGTVHEMGPELVRIQMRQSGGQAIMPINFASIDQIRLLD